MIYAETCVCGGSVHINGTKNEIRAFLEPWFQEHNHCLDPKPIPEPPRLFEVMKTKDGFRGKCTHLGCFWICHTGLEGDLHEYMGEHLKEHNLIR